MPFRLTFNQIASIGIVILIIAVAVFGYYVGHPSHTAGTTATSTTTVTPFNFGNATHFYELVFNQTFFCPVGSSSYGLIVIPWAVTLDNNYTIDQPSNVLAGSGISSTYDLQFATIVFSVPDGTYSFTVIPQGFNVQNGTVTVDGQDVEILLHYNAPSCVSATTSRTTTPA